MSIGRVWGLAALLCSLALQVLAEAPAPWLAPRGALIPGLGALQDTASRALLPDRVQTASLAAPSAGGGSLFAGRAGQSLFAPVTRQAHEPQGGMWRAPPLGGDLVSGLRFIIAEAEAGRAGYDAVQHGARVRPPRRPTQMTLAEIFAWIDATPGQPHAIGLYQFIPSTLRRVVRIAGVPNGARFDPAMQDRLADILLEEAGLSDARAGRLSRTAFMNNLAKIWAGLPNASGRSHYDGYAGNKATISRARFEAVLAPHLPG